MGCDLRFQDKGSAFKLYRMFNGRPIQSSGSIRWAFNFQAWDPTEQEWLLASQCINLEEKQRIRKFVFQVDAKASIAGRLMMRKFAHLATGLPYEDIILSRDHDNRPFLKNGNIPLDFNVSHQGQYAVLAGEIDTNLRVGVDIMDFQRKEGRQLSEFLRLMKRQLCEEEWNMILDSPSDEKRAETFFRFWCLKESYLKATGIGLRTDLRRISFKLNASLSHDKICDDTSVQIDGTKSSSWTFHESLLDSRHCVAAAFYSPSNTLPKVHVVPFSTLSWPELVCEAKPFLPPDLTFCEEFFRKEDGPHYGQK